MVAHKEYLCIKSYALTAQNGDHFEIKQGKVYTGTLPSIDPDHITIWNGYIVPVHKDHLVEKE